MPTDDVVAELDAWLEITSGEPDAQWLTERPMIKRARDEIVALRDRNRSSDVRAEHLQRDARDEALEEAAQACVGSGAIVAEARLCASAIRALKEKRDD